MNILIRTMEDGDIPFVTDTWLNHYKNHSYFAKRIKHSIYMSWHRPLIHRILSRARSLIAYSEDDPEICLGYIVYENNSDIPLLHFLFVLESIRHMGIGKQLFNVTELSPDTLYFNHWTFDTDKLVVKYPNAKFDPYRL